MDSAIFVSGANNIAHQIEVCECDVKYSSNSCQDANDGYYIFKNATTDDYHNINDYKTYVGMAVPCSCSGRSKICDKKTGKCLNCTNNTSGYSCEKCAEGFYGDPNKGECSPCPCPETQKKFAKGCNVTNYEVSCICKPGYVGALCDRCETGYFGDPENDNGKCEPCDCNPEGTSYDGCNSHTGECYCREGITGRRCDRCIESRKIVQDRTCKCKYKIKF